MAEILSEKIDPSLSLRMTGGLLRMTGAIAKKDRWIAQEDSASEWVSHAEMEGIIVTFEPFARIYPFLLASGVVNLHAEVEAQE